MKLDGHIRYDIIPLHAYEINETQYKEGGKVGRNADILATVAVLFIGVPGQFRRDGQFERDKWHAQAD